MKLEVTRKTIPEVLDLMRRGHWQVPDFQREFVWTRTQVFGLLRSIFKPRPIGMITVWAQPQNQRHCSSRPVSLDSVSFADSSEQPAVISLILDGRQRLTTLAIAFGGLREDDERKQNSGRWFVNLDKSPDDDEFVCHKKRKELSRVQSKANCIVAALLPLDDYPEFKYYMTHSRDPGIYPNNTLPPDDVLNRRLENITRIYETFQTFQIPVAELPDTITLADVCDIFNVLNTTGTKVSVFDLIHNQLFQESGTDFHLRNVFKQCQDQPFYSRLCDKDRPEFFCQTVTACYLSEKERKGRKAGSLVQSIKGESLLNTPLQFYRTFTENVQRVDSYCLNLFTSITEEEFDLNDIPYPVSVLLYIALRWSSERSDGGARFKPDQLDRMFRAFFWRNVLSQRYDQGFLTKFATDLEQLTEILSRGQKLQGQQWADFANSELDRLFGVQYPKMEPALLKVQILGNEVRGALRQAITMFFYSRTKQDIVSGATLDRFNESKGMTVQLHHIVPRQWVQDNQVRTDPEIEIDTCVESMANLVPLTAKSNNEWRAKEPGKALSKFGVHFKSHEESLRGAFIDHAAFSALIAIPPAPAEFWKSRAALIAAECCQLQNVE